MSSDVIIVTNNNNKTQDHIFDDNFIKEKEMALEPINDLFETEHKRISIQKNRLSVELPKEERHKKKSIKNSEKYDSNIIIVNSVIEDDTEPSSFNKLEKELEKINKMIQKNKLKKKK